MKPAPFVRHVPRTVEEATDMLAEFGPKTAAYSRADKVSFRSWLSGWRGRLISLTSTASPSSLGYRGSTTPFPSARLSATRRFIGRPSMDKWVACFRPSCATSRIIRSGPAALSAGASPMPIPHRNGVWLPRRSGQKWLQRANADTASLRQRISSRRHDDCAGGG